ncbi:MAG: cupin domain-containing protein [Gammaproteobacteria bacterium]
MTDLGLRLRHVRQLHRLSQRELARRSGVSNATISLIENQRTDPSLGMLKRILDAIPISLGDFFGMEVSSEPKVFFSADELVEIGQGAISYRQVGGDLREHAIQMLHETYQPGADTGQSPLTHEGEEVGIVLAGLLEVTVGGQARILRPGDAYQFSSQIPHRFRNVGKQDCVVVSACTPPTF